MSTMQNRAGLRHFLDSFGGTEHSNVSSNSTATGLSQTSANEKDDTKPRPDVKLSHLASSVDSPLSIQTIETRLADLLDSTLWNRRLAPSSERIVYALVQQIFHGIREYFLASTELKVCDMYLPHCSSSSLSASFFSFKLGTIAFICQTSNVLIMLIHIFCVIFRILLFHPVADSNCNSMQQHIKLLMK